MNRETEEPTRQMGPTDDDAPWELPDRQALSILTDGTGGLALPQLDSSGSPTVGDTASAGSQTGDSAGQLAHTAGDASGSGQESITSDPRSETFTSSDSAYAGPDT